MAFGSSTATTLATSTDCSPSRANRDRIDCETPVAAALVRHSTLSSL